jgi:hypothetical protein
MMNHFRMAQIDLSSLPTAGDICHQQPAAHQASVAAMADLVAQRLLDSEPPPQDNLVEVANSLQRRETDLQTRETTMMTQMQEMMASVMHHNNNNNNNNNNRCNRDNRDRGGHFPPGRGRGRHGRGRGNERWQRMQFAQSMQHDPSIPGKILIQSQAELKQSILFSKVLITPSGQNR